MFWFSNVLKLREIFVGVNENNQPNISLTSWDPAGASDSNNLHWLSERLVSLVILGDPIKGPLLIRWMR